MRSFKTAAAICVLVLGAGALCANAASFTWTGADDTNWQRYDGNPLVADNWNVPGYPGRTGDSDNALIPDTSGGSNRYPVLSSDETIANLTINDGGDLTINNSSVLTVTSTTIIQDAANDSTASATAISGGSGVVSTGSIQMNGGADGLTVTVTSCTVQTTS